MTVPKEQHWKHTGVGIDGRVGGNRPGAALSWAGRDPDVGVERTPERQHPIDVGVVKEEDRVEACANRYVSATDIPES